MSSVNVYYNFQTFRVKIEASEHLQSVLDQSISHFELNTGTDTQARYRFLHNNKPVPLDLPWRLLNLSAGARLDLDIVELPVSSSDTCQTGMGNQQIKVRFQVNNGYGSIVESVGTEETLGPVLKRVASKQQWSARDRELPPSSIKIQIFSRMINGQEIEDLTLHELGIHSSISVRVTLPDTDTPSEYSTGTQQEQVEDETSNTILDPSTQVQPSIGEISAPTPFKEPKVYIAPKIPIAKQLSETSNNWEDNHDNDNDDDSVYELTVEQARKYQQMLSNRAGTLGGPLLTKRLREELEKDKEAPVHTVKECQVRVKFPDLSLLELYFSPDDTMETVYSRVAGLLVNETWDFKLSETHPHKYLARDTQGSLYRDLKFGPKIVLLFEPVEGVETPTAPFLKSSIMSKAEELSLKHTDTTSSKPIGITNESNGTDTMKEKAKKLTSGKLPKWFKMARK